MIESKHTYVTMWEDGGGFGRKDSERCEEWLN